MFGRLYRTLGLVCATVVVAQASAFAGTITGIVKRADILSPNGHGGIELNLYSLDNVPSMTAWGVFFLILAASLLLARAEKPKTAGIVAVLGLALGVTTAVQALGVLLATTTTENDGSFIFEDMPPRDYFLIASDEGYFDFDFGVITVPFDSPLDLGTTILGDVPTPTPTQTPTPTPALDEGWTAQIGSSADEAGNAIAADAAGNLYVAGYSLGDFDGLVNANSSGATRDFFLMKHDFDGNKAWTILEGTTADDEALDVSVNATGESVIVGYTAGDLGSFTNIGSTDAFVAKYTTSGAQDWLQVLGTSDADSAISVHAYDSGEALVAGSTRGNLLATNAGMDDVFVIKFDASGNPAWTEQYGSADRDYAFGALADGNRIYVTGYTGGDLDGNISNGQDDIFLTKLIDNTTSVTREWTVTLGTSNSDRARGIDMDSNGILYLTGETVGSLDGVTANSSLDFFVARFNRDGQLLGVNQDSSTSSDVGRDITVLPNGQHTVVGKLAGDFYSYPAQGGDDLFFSEYDSAGNPIANFLIGTSGNDEAFGVTYATDDTLYITGSTAGDLRGNTNLGGLDVFLGKWRH